MNTLRLLIRRYEEADESEVIALWQLCRLVVPWNDPHDDIARKLQVQPHLFLVGTFNTSVIATVMAGYEGHCGWLNYLAVAPNYQQQGVGRQLVEEAMSQLKRLGCPKINLQIRTSNLDVITFYKRLGFTVDDVVSMGKRL